MGNRIDFEDIISKPVVNSYKKVQTLGIYCCNYDWDEILDRTVIDAKDDNITT